MIGSAREQLDPATTNIVWDANRYHPYCTDPSQLASTAPTPLWVLYKIGGYFQESDVVFEMGYGCGRSTRVFRDILLQRRGESVTTNMTLVVASELPNNYLMLMNGQLEVNSEGDEASVADSDESDSNESGESGESDSNESGDSSSEDDEYAEFEEELGKLTAKFNKFELRYQITKQSR